jgi:hypothetical protein
MFLMHIHADILSASHKQGVPFWKGSSRTLKTLLQKGRPFILRPLLRKWPLKYSFFREAQRHFLPSLSGRSLVNCFSETGFYFALILATFR